jgi:dTDP-4-dehydrorhamnose 3,5-epimerase
MLPEGVAAHPLDPHRDERGVFTELFRESWGLSVAPVQWNAVRSEANVLRGVHAHWRHSDYLTLVAGRATIGLHDLREGSPTEGLGATVELAAESASALVIPTGVAHGFYFHEPSIHLYSVTHYWDEADELGCHWADPELGIPWPFTTALVSPRDAEAQSLRELLAEIEPYQPIV